MSLLSLSARPDPSGTSRTTVVGRPVEVVPSVAPIPGPPPVEYVGPDLRRAKAAERLASTLLATSVDDDDLARLEADVDELVQVWTPSMHLHSRFELMSVLVDVDDAIGEIAVSFTATAVTSSSVLLEWMATGRFNGPLFLVDDELVEPTGAVIRAAGVLSLAFDHGQRATRISCYYDRLALIEQVLHPPSST